MDLHCGEASACCFATSTTSTAAGSLSISYVSLLSVEEAYRRMIEMIMIMPMILILIMIMLIINNNNK